MNAHSPSTSRTILAVLAVCLAITAFILIGLNAYMKQPSSNSQYVGSNTDSSCKNNSYKEGYEAARKSFSRIFPSLQQESLSVSGVIIALNPNGFTFTQDSLAVDPVADGVSDTRTITVNEKTEINAIAEKDPDVFRKETQDFLEKIKGSSEPGSPPIPLVNTKASLNDLKPGMRVSIYADTDVRFLTTIPAMSISFTKNGQ
ncbi:hypothetical protein IT408_01845 [Candidatus Uhrbacteria bacterium]|nr:hypothetical protein [Candidatus Uhrbacteria bacterium]